MFIETLEKTLKEKNLTLNKLSKAVGFSQASTSRWKQGSFPSVDVLKNICEYLNVSADYLLELEPPPDISNEERILLEYFRAADNRGQEYILDIAKREASRAVPPEEKLLDSKIG